MHERVHDEETWLEKGCLKPYPTPTPLNTAHVVRLHKLRMAVSGAGLASEYAFGLKADSPLSSSCSVGCCCGIQGCDS